MSALFIHHGTARPRFGEEDDGFDVIEAGDGLSIWHRSIALESDFATPAEAEARAWELAEDFDRDALTLDLAEEWFAEEATDKSAAALLNEARRYHRDDMIGDDSFYAIICRVGAWLADDGKLRD